MSDLKTLRLASLQLSPERLEAFVVYQRTLLAELARATATDWSGRYAFAHGHALAASKLDLVELGKLKSLVGDFCGRRTSLAQLKARIEKGGTTEKDLAVVARAQKELRRFEDLAPFEDRYGKDALALLLAREAELLTLHRDLARSEGTGHVHPG
jgi:hypothetical protein